jgi:hypothetical protein
MFILGDAGWALRLKTDSNQDYIMFSVAFRRSVHRIVLMMFGVAGGVAVTGCTTRPPFLTNADPALRKSAATFAADAAHRSYEADAPNGGHAQGTNEVDYGIDRLTIVNTSNDDWNDVEIWLNKKYVIMVPQIPAHAARAEMISFKTIYDQNGNYFPLDSSVTPIDTIEMYRDGKMYSLGPVKLPD